MSHPRRYEYPVPEKRPMLSDLQQGGHHFIMTKGSTAAWQGEKTRDPGDPNERENECVPYKVQI